MGSSAHKLCLEESSLSVLANDWAVWSRIRSSRQQQQQQQQPELQRDAAIAMLNKVTRGRLFADNELWILAALPLCLVPPSIYHDKLFAATSPYHILPLHITGWHPDWLMILPPPLRCPIVFCFIYPSMNGAPVSSHLDLTEPLVFCPYLLWTPLPPKSFSLCLLVQIVLLLPLSASLSSSSSLQDFSTSQQFSGVKKKKDASPPGIGANFQDVSPNFYPDSPSLLFHYLSLSRKKKKKKHWMVHKQKNRKVASSPYLLCSPLFLLDTQSCAS